MSAAQLIATILAFPALVKYGALFVLAVVEGPLITMIAGLLGAQGRINIYAAYLTILSADILADCAYYALGRWGGKKLEKKYFALTKTSPARLSRVQRLLIDHPRKTLVLGKLTHVAGVPVLVGAGLARIRLRTLFIYNTLATLPKSLFFILVGFYLGNGIESFNKYLTYSTYFILGTILIVFVGYIILGKYMEKKLID